MTCSKIKSRLKKEEEGMFWSMVFIFPSNHYTWWDMFYQMWLNICLPMGSSGWTPHFALFVYAAFALYNKLPSYQPEFSHFSNSPPSKMWRLSSICVALSCLSGLNQKAQRIMKYASATNWNSNCPLNLSLESDKN